MSDEQVNTTLADVAARAYSDASELFLAACRARDDFDRPASAFADVIGNLFVAKSALDAAAHLLCGVDPLTGGEGAPLYRWLGEAGAHIGSRRYGSAEDLRRSSLGRARLPCYKPLDELACRGDADGGSEHVPRSRRGEGR